jgi:hypothetical protein
VAVKLLRSTPKRPLRPLRPLRMAGVAAASVLLLAACGSTAPGVAAEVDGERISDEQVDAFADILCSIGGVQGTESGVPAKSARFTSLQILISNVLAGEMADLDEVSQQSVAATLQNMAVARDILDEDQQETFDEVAEEFARAQAAIMELGRQSLEDAGTPAKKLTDDAAYAEGQKLLAEHAAESDIEVDPRYGEVVDGALEQGSGSLSVPVSDLAVAGDAAEQGEELVALLPASQKCEPPS